MGKIAKFFLFITTLLVTFILGLAILGAILEDRIVAAAVEQLNKQLKVSIKVKEIDASLIRGFPRASVVMRSVEVIEGSLAMPTEFEPGLLSVEEVTLRFGMLGLLRKEYEIDELILKNGWLNLYFNNSGEANFNIFKEQDEGESASWLLELDRIRLQNINLSYIDIRTGWIFKGLIRSTSVFGTVTKDQVFLNVDATCQVGVLRQGGFYYIRNQRVNIKTEFLMSQDLLDIGESKAEIGNTSLNIGGSLGRRKGDPVFLNISGSDISPDLLVSFLLQHSAILPPNMRSRGKVAFQLSLEGQSKTEKPFNINLNFASNSLEFSMPNRPPLTVNSINGTFTNGNLGTLKSSELFVSKFDIATGNSKVNGSFRLRNLLSPLYHLRVNHAIDIKDALAWGIELPVISGESKGNFEALGTLQNLNNISLQHFENSRFNSTLTLTGWDFQEVGRIPNLKQVSGTVSISNQDIDNATLEGLLHGSKFKAEMQATNAGGVLFGNRKAVIITNLVVDSLNTIWLLARESSSLDEGIDTSSGSTWDRVHSLSGDIFIDELVHKNFISTPLSANFTYKDSHLNCNSFLGRASGGLLTGKLAIDFKENQQQQLSAHLDLDGINITQLFEAFNNFEQDVIQSTNISGDLNGTLVFSTPLSRGNMVKEGLQASANIRINQGRLRNVNQLNSLSRFVAVDELKDIQFSTLENTVVIEDQIVRIPQMQVNSSALNLSLSGTHSFEGNYSYRLHLLLSDLLYGKAIGNKRENSEFGHIEDDGSGRARIFLRLEGDNENYNVTYDAAAARDAFRQNLRTERDELKGILRDEFQFLRRGDTTDSLANEKTKKDSVPSPKFTIEWDDE